MPFTPFHFGPGAALHALAPRQVSFLAFCAANVVTDVEPGLNMLLEREPLHAFLHTYVGAAVSTAATIALYFAARALARRLPLPDVFAWKSLTPRPVIAGAAVGAFTHVAIDSVMHADMRPLAPFSLANPMLLWVSIDALQWTCVALGAAGAVLLALRALWKRERRA